MQSDLQNDAPLEQTIAGILTGQRFGVLTTDGQGQPYAHLVAFAGLSNLSGILFFTGRATRKFLNMRANSKVAILVDSRAGTETDVATAVAVTALGSAREISGAERQDLTQVFIAKHPTLEIFAARPENSLILIEVTEFNVASFDKTWRYIVGPGK
jgi:nitroimidazol reductase NimA-like FMN-containing flavoprotein (pyridoxamine 5'-phosphate oxidase superfamily)